MHYPHEDNRRHVCRFKHVYNKLLIFTSKRLKELHIYQVLLSATILQYGYLCDLVQPEQQEICLLHAGFWGKHSMKNSLCHDIHYASWGCRLFSAPKNEEWSANLIKMALYLQTVFCFDVFCCFFFSKQNNFRLSNETPTCQFRWSIVPLRSCNHELSHKSHLSGKIALKLYVPAPHAFGAV